MTRSISEKLGVTPNMRTLFINAPDDFSKNAAFPLLDLKQKRIGTFDYIHYFVITQKEFHKHFPILKNHLNTKGMLWLSWPKSKRKLTDLNIQKVIELGYTYGLVESKVVSIDEIWSAIKFTHPINGKIYNNSYGQLLSNQ